jgi:hypothetical protein
VDLWFVRGEMRHEKESQQGIVGGGNGGLGIAGARKLESHVGLSAAHPDFSHEHVGNRDGVITGDRHDKGLA